jgi:hypothetical protein
LALKKTLIGLSSHPDEATTSLAKKENDGGKRREEEDYNDDNANAPVSMVRPVSNIIKAIMLFT